MPGLLLLYGFLQWVYICDILPDTLSWQVLLYSQDCMPRYVSNPAGICHGVHLSEEENMSWSNFLVLSCNFCSIAVILLYIIAKLIYSVTNPVHFMCSWGHPITHELFKGAGCISLHKSMMLKPVKKCQVFSLSNQMRTAEKLVAYLIAYKLEWNWGWLAQG